jgi:trans-aconitate 2-methyltransferase
MSAARDATPTEWDAASYHRISSPMVRWGSALLSTVELRGDELVLDAGCGTGLLTEQLLERLPQGRAVGIDRSMAMASTARRHLEAASDRFHALQADLCNLPLASASLDLVFSTATFHWISDHPRLFREVGRVLQPGGRLVAQCGGAGNIEQVHGWAREARRSPELARYFAGWHDPWEFATADQCARRLRAAGLRVEHCGLHEEPTVLDGAATFAEFVRTVVLRPFLACIPSGSLQDGFVDAVTVRAASASPPWSLDYVRLTMVARKP